jgi:HJR/Mrr/RecB family endonuclease
VRTRRVWEIEAALNITGLCAVIGAYMLYVRSLGLRTPPYILPLLVAVPLIIWSLALFSLRLRNARRQTLAQLQALTPTEFEDWVGARFRKLGYHVRLTGMGGDHGADLLVEKPGERAIVQCKRYTS